MNNAKKQAGENNLSPLKPSKAFYWTYWIWYFKTFCNLQIPSVISLLAAFSIMLQPVSIIFA